MYVGNTATAFPIQSSSGWYKIEAHQPMQGQNATGSEMYIPAYGRRPVVFAAIGHASTISGGIVVTSLQFLPLGGTAAAPNGTTIFGNQVGTWPLITGDASAVYPTTDSGVDTKWRLSIGNTNYAEWKSQRTSTSMTYVLLGGSPPAPQTGQPWLVVSAADDPFSASSSGTGEWTRGDIDTLLSDVFDMRYATQKGWADLMDGNQGAPGKTNLLDIVQKLDEILAAIPTPPTQTGSDLLNAILGEMIADPSYLPTKAKVQGTRTVPFKNVPRDDIKPALDDAVSETGTFGDPYSGESVAIPEGNKIISPTVSGSGLSYTVDLNVLGGRYGDYPGGSNLLPSNLVLSCDFGPVRPFVNICRWLMVGMVTLLTAERVFSEFRRM